MNLDNIIGVNVKVTNVINESTVGRIYSWNTDSNTLTLLTNSPKNNGKQQQQQQQTEALFSFKLLKISFIQKIEVVPNQSQPASQAYLRKDPLKPHHVYSERVENFINEEINKYKEQN